MRILLVNAEPFHVEHKAAIPLGLLSIATYMKAKGHTVEIYDRVVEGTGIKRRLESFRPDIVGVSALAVKSFPDAVKVSKTVKKKNIPVVWGGPVPSLIPEIALKTGSVDFVVVGEGEITFSALTDALARGTPLRAVDGLAFMENGKPVVNKPREPADLSDLPVIDFGFVDPKKYFTVNVGCERMLHIYSSKGCPYQCTYCYNPCFSKSLWRPRPAEYFLNEIRYLAKNHGLDGVFFADDLFSPKREYLRTVCQKIKEAEIDFVWGCDMRADICSKEDLRMMHDAGCRWIFFGIESGSADRQKELKKRVHLEKAREAVDWCKEIGIFTTTTFIMGLPDETEEELKDTIRYVQNLAADVKLASFYGPIPASELYRDLVESRRLEEPKTYKEWGKLAWMDTLGKNFSKVPGRDLKVISGWFLWSSISGKNRGGKTEKRIYAKKAVGQTFDALKRGTLNSLILVFLSGKKFLQIVFYATMFPGIRKKYNLR